ncbi:MAG TPA: amidohydrolase [Syntrophales bacterium]|nr:amidohydrolase [Syntrophales bacterium]
MESHKENSDLDILIEGGTLLTMSDSMDVIYDPIIGIKDGRIELVTVKDIQRTSSYRAKEVLDASGSVIMPGLINTHTHLPMVCFRGLADDLPLMEWLNNHIFPAEARFVNRDMVYAGSMLAIAEMILSGTTTFCDAYFYESSVAGAAVDSRMRAVVSQGFIDRPNHNDPSKISDIAERFINKWQGKSPLITPSLACHSPYACAPETLIRIKDVARKAGMPYNIHVSETKEEVAIIKERFGKRPVQYLRDLNLLDDLTLAVHCNWLDEDEMEILRAFDVKVSHNPESNMKLAAGCAPVPDMIKKGITVGLGTDGCASNNDMDMFREMDTAAKVHKVIRLDPTVMDAKTVLRMATIGGAKVLGLGDKIGSIEPGKLADIIIIDMKKPHLVPLYNYYSQLVYAASGSDVTTSIIGGNIVMHERKLLHVDLPSIIHEVRKIAQAIGDNYTISGG